MREISPVLKKSRTEPFLEPHVSNMVANWYALYVKSRHEFFTRGELVKRGIETFLPSLNVTRLWKDRKKIVAFPVFPGYLFVHLVPCPEEFVRVLRTLGSVSFISFESGKPITVPNEEINSLKTIISSGKEFDIYPDLREGMRVKIIKGPLRHAEGILIRKGNNSIFAVNIHLLGRSLEIKVNGEDLVAL